MGLNVKVYPGRSSLLLYYAGRRERRLLAPTISRGLHWGNRGCQFPEQRRSLALRPLRIDNATMRQRCCSWCNRLGGREMSNTAPSHYSSSITTLGIRLSQSAMRSTCQKKSQRRMMRGLEADHALHRITGDYRPGPRSGDDQDSETLANLMHRPIAHRITFLP